MTEETHDGPIPEGDYVTVGEHAELLERVHRRGSQLRRRRQALVGSLAVAAALVVAVPLVAATGDGPAPTSDLASDGGDGSGGGADPDAAPAAAETTLPPSATTSAASCAPDCLGNPTTSSAPTSVPPTSSPTPGPSSPSATAPPASTTTSTPPTTAPPTTTPPGPPPVAECPDGSTGDTAIWVSNQSFAVPTQRIEVRVDGVVLTDRDFDVEGQHAFVMFCVDLGPGDHTVVAETASDAAAVTATAGNGVVVLAWDGGDVMADVSPRWDQVGFA